MPDLIRMLVMTLDTRLEWSLPEAAEVEAGFESAAAASQDYWHQVGVERERAGDSQGDWTHAGDWAGAVRITRRNRGLAGYTMTAAAPWVIPAYTLAEMQAHGLDEASALRWQERALSQIEHQLYQHFARVDSSWQLQTTSYNPTINGALSWWSSGQAARTQSRFAAPGALGVADPVENPVGPSSRDLRPATTTEIVSSATGSIAKPVMIAGLVILGLFLWTSRGNG